VHNLHSLARNTWQGTQAPIQGTFMNTVGHVCLACSTLEWMYGMMQFCKACSLTARIIRTSAERTNAAEMNSACATSYAPLCQLRAMLQGVQANWRP
jgi:hypothetical protein